LGWFSPVWLGGVEVRDERGEILLEIPEVAGDRWLLGLLWDSSRLGRFRLREPKLHLAFRENGSNLEDVLAEYLSSTKPTTPVDIALEVVGGTVTLAETRSQKSGQIEQVQCSFRLPLDRAKPIELSASGIVPEGRIDGQFATDVRIRQTAGKDAARTRFSGAEISLKTERISLSAFNGLLGRLSPGLRLGGRLTSSLASQWNSPDAPDRVSIHGNLAADNFTLAAAALGTEQLQLQRLVANCHVVWQDGQLLVNQFVADSDLGSTSLVGLFRWGAPGQDGLNSLLRQTYEVQGQVDLAQLARMLPQTLRIRRGTQITSGQMSLALSSRAAPEGMVWQGRFETTNLTAQSGGRQLIWEQPLLITLSARETGQGPILENLKCESSFLRVNMSGTRDQLIASANVDLNRLVAQLAGFVDLGGVRLAGDGWAHFSWKRSRRQGGFEADADLQVRSFQLAIPNRPAWLEENLVVIASATGRTDFSVNSRLDEALLKIEAGPDRLEARLLQPVVGFQRGGTWPVDIRAQGQIARWMPRVGVWTTLADWRLSGFYEVVGQVSYSADAIRLSRLRFAVGQLELIGPWLNVREPIAELIISGRFHRPGRRLEAEQASFTTNNVAAQASNLVAAWPPQGPPELSGTITCQASLEQLQQWFARTNSPPTWQAAGQLIGRAEFRQSMGLIEGRFETGVNNVGVVHKSGRRVQEPQVRLAGRGSYNHQNRTILIERLELSSAGLGGALSGRVASANSLNDVQLDGQVEYDLARLSAWLQAYTGGVVHIAGRHTSPISYRGPLNFTAGQATASVRWDWAELYGFRAESGELQAALNGGVLQVRPFELAVNEGRIRLAPEIRWNTKQAELYLPPGRVAEQVRVNPLLCAAALQYVAPVLAGTTSIEGRFSVDVQHCRIPLADPAQSEAIGRITLHSAQVGPGPLIQELALILGRASPAQLNRESALEFQIVGARIYHKGLELAFPELTVRTYGSVGLDQAQTLAMIAEMPLPARWRDNPLVATAVKDQVLRIPIGGTLARPQVDRQALGQISSQFFQNAAQNVIGEALKGQLDRALPQQPRTNPMVGPQQPRGASQPRSVFAPQRTTR